MSDVLRGFDPRATFDAASLDYEEASRRYWEFLSERAVRLVAPRPGEDVVDVACGTGPALIPAARAVGPTGTVLGIDFAPRMLAIAETKVRDAGLANVRLRTGDMTALDLPDASVDVVLCILGLFFVEDMPGLVRSLRRLLRRPGGRLGITVLGDRFLEPMLGIFVEAVHAERPGFDVVEPWKRTADPETLRAVAEEGGLHGFEMTADVDVLPLEEPAGWWPVVMGTGLRRTAEALGEETADAVRLRCERAIDERGIRELEVSSQHLVATEPA